MEQILAFKVIFSLGKTFFGCRMDQTPGAHMKMNKLFGLICIGALLAACAAPEQKPADSAAAKPPAPVLTGDALIAANVKSALDADAELKGAKIAVTSTDGVIVLKGEIKTLVLRRKVEAIVKGVKDVKSFNNQLVVTG
jgi:hyperosmotically inducible periplasmic protein